MKKALFEFIAFAVILFFIFSSLFYSSASSKKDSDILNININCSESFSKIIPFSEINCGPLPIHYIKNGVEISKQYKEIGINFIRTHDFYGPTDISNIFPNWSAGPFLESSYNFSSSDEHIKAIVDSGFKVFYRLGESASDEKILREPPENFTKWAEICKHIVMHYNDGWNNGYHYNITYWEIWNEPDLKGFWNGTAKEYYKLYEITSKILKNYNSSLKIGGPCTSSVFNENFTTSFLKYVAENNLPLDFFSWHMYTDNPYELYKASVYVRRMLDEYGFNQCENINTEWNIDILSPQRDKDNEKNSAFTACCLTIFQDACIDYAFRYRGTQDNNWLSRLLGFDLSLFNYEGVYKKPALSYLAMHYMAEDTPFRLSNEKMNASDGITYLAGISEDGSNISILISNYNSPDIKCILNLTNLPWNASYREIHYLIDKNHHLEIVENKTFSDSNYFSIKKIGKNTVHFIRLTNSTAIPKEGPKVAKIPFLLRLRFLDPLIRIIGIILLSLIFG